MANLSTPSTRYIPTSTPDQVRIGDTSLTLRDVGPSDEQAVVALHTQVFGPDVDVNWFAWKYGHAPAQGQGQAVGLWNGSDLIGYCGGVPRVLWHGETTLQGLQIGDVMIHPKWRGILTRRGPFFHVSQRFYQSRIGSLPSFPFQLSFGFPSQRHLRLAVMLGLLHDGGTIENLHWDTAGASLPAFWQWSTLQPTNPRFERSVNRVWKSMHQSRIGHLCIGQRDADYVRWRYIERPPSVNAPHANRYSFFQLRRPWSLFPEGLAVLAIHDKRAQWLDWIGPLELMPLAVRASRWELYRSGVHELTAWASPAVANWLHDSGIAHRDVCSGLGIPTTSALTDKDRESLQWWLMGGDTDFL